MPDRFGMPHRPPSEDNLPYGVTSKDIDDHFGGPDECPNDACEDGKVTCPECGGNGWLVVEKSYCENCDGEGTIECDTCEGEGYV